MIAIIGAKGGCGKTTTTLGLATAFARAETPTLAIDTDRQLPDLHQVAGVDRTPTIASLDGSEDVGAVAQTIPEQPGVSVLPGPKPAESADIQRTLQHIDSVSARILVDCPSGAGPDVTDPLSAANEAIVVTTTNGESLKDAQTTVDLARRLEVPIAGIVVTKAESVPESVYDRFEPPVLAAVPGSESPFVDEQALAAYDRAVDALDGDADPDSDTDSVDPAVQVGTKLPLGVDGLDETLGGVPPGTIIAMKADPDSRAERLLHKLTATRGTLYLTTDRPERLVRDALERESEAVGSPAVRRVSRADPVSETTELLADLPEGTNVVVDVADRLEEADPGEYLSLLETLKERVVETNSLAVLHCLDRDPVPENRHLTERVADAVFSVDADSRQRLDVSKYRPDADAVGSVPFLSTSAGTDPK